MFKRSICSGMVLASIILVQGLITGCASTDYSDAGAVEEEILYIFEEWTWSIREADTDWYVSLYLEDADKIHVAADGSRIVYHGQEAISEQINSVFESMGESLSAYEPPQSELIFDPATDTQQIVMRDGDGKVARVLRFAMEDGDWYIGEQWTFERFFPEPEAAEFSHPVDHNGNGVLEIDEQRELFHMFERLMEGPGRVDNPFMERFDWNFNGFYEEWEMEIARNILLRGRMMQLPGEFDDYTRRYIDYDGSGRVSIHEGNLLLHGIDGRSHLPGHIRGPEDELRDYNSDGFVSAIELEAYRDLAFRVAAVNPAPFLYTRESPAMVEDIRNWADTDRNGTLDEEELETVWYSLADVMEGEVPVITPVHRFFDRNRSGIVEYPEAEWGRRELLRFLPQARERRTMVYNAARDREMMFSETPPGREEYSEDFLSGLSEALGQRQQELPRAAEGGLDSLWDFNGDGRLDNDELFFLRSMAAQAAAKVWLKLPPREADSVRVRSVLDRAADADGDGILSPRERIDSIVVLTGPQPVSSGFGRNIDSDGNGMLTAPELAHAREAGFIPANGGEQDSSALTSSAYRPPQETTDSGPVKRTSLKGGRLAVLGVRDMTEKMGKGETDLLVSFLENAFVNFGNATVVDRQNLEKIMEEHRYQVSALVDEETAVEIGKLSGADAIAIGNVSRLGSLYYLHLKLINVQTGAIIGSSISQGETEDDFLTMCNGAVSPLF